MHKTIEGHRLWQLDYRLETSWSRDRHLTYISSASEPGIKNLTDWIWAHLAYPFRITGLMVQDVTDDPNVVIRDRIVELTHENPSWPVQNYAYA